MDFILGLFVAVKSLIFVGGVVDPNSAAARIDSLQIMPGDSIRASCMITNAFPPELRKLAQTGTPIILYLYTELRQNKPGAIVSRSVEEHHLLLDISESRYAVSGGASTDTLQFGSLDTAIAAFSVFRSIFIVTKDRISRTGEYAIAVYAVLGKTTIEALSNNSIDLMYYWKYRRPSLRTERFPGSALLGNKGK